jgi:hypothetical protein
LFKLFSGEIFLFVNIVDTISVVFILSKFCIRLDISPCNELSLFEDVSILAGCNFCSSVVVD